MGLYLAGVGPSPFLAGTEHGGSHPAKIVLVTDLWRQYGHIHLLEPVNARTICGTRDQNLHH